METKVNSNAKRTAIKVSLVAAISLLLLIPLAMIKGVIEDREQTKDTVTMEVANSYAKPQTVSAPYLESYVVETRTVDKKIEPSGKQTYVEDYDSYCSQVDYTADVETDVLHRSIYDVIVYNYIRFQIRSRNGLRFGIRVCHLYRNRILSLFAVFNYPFNH